MKHIKLLLALALFFVASATNAQKFAYIDAEYILAQMPEFKSAQKQLDDIAADWQKDIESKMAEVDKLYREYQEEKVLLTDDLRKKREKAIDDKEKIARDLQKQRFAPDGELYKKRQELIKPIQDKVFDAVQKVAKKSGLDFIFDKSGDMTMLFANAKFDKSDEVLEDLGVTVAERKKEEAPKDPKEKPQAPKNTPPQKPR
ncbi:MAG: OmpH family outer membrane protein [Flavobacteriaceae bacterium]|nr:OmpH family outer membrane protein [Flavobacteriaceae bacterium]